MRVFYSFLIMFYHTCQVAVTEIHETFSSGVLPLQGRRLEGRKKKRPGKQRALKDLKWN